MGHELHITRAEHWTDSDRHPIPLAEWRSFVGHDRELVLVDDDDVAERFQIGPADPGLVVWIGAQARDRARVLGWLRHQQDHLVSKHPDDAMVRKMHTIAQLLGARVVGDEGEQYGVDGYGGEPDEALVDELVASLAPPASRRSIVWPLLLLWWVSMALLLWFLWDLAAFAEPQPRSQWRFPGLPIAFAGWPMASVGLFLALSTLWRVPRRRERWVLALATIVFCGWLLVASPVADVGARLHLRRHEDAFLAEVAEVRAKPTAALAHQPSMDAMFVDGQPPRFGFAPRWVAEHQWACFVFDPHGTIDPHAAGMHIFGGTLVRQLHLWGDWHLAQIAR